MTDPIAFWYHGGNRGRHGEFEVNGVKIRFDRTSKWVSAKGDAPATRRDGMHLEITPRGETVPQTIDIDTAGETLEKGTGYMYVSGVDVEIPGGLSLSTSHTPIPEGAARALIQIIDSIVEATIGKRKL